MAILKSIDVLRVCLVCGPVNNTVDIGGKQFCAKCLAEALETMVPVVKMQVVENEVEVGEGHYLCVHCGKLTPNGRTCQHCGR